MNTELKREDKVYGSPVILIGLINDIKNLRRQLSSLYDFKQQPVPFFYVHMLNLLIALYLPLFSFAVAKNIGSFEESYLCVAQDEGSFDGFDELGFGVCTAHLQDEVVTVVVLLMFQILVVGLSQAGRQLSDPFGTDLVDMPVKRFVTFALQASEALMRAELDSECTHSKLNCSERWTER